MALDRIVRWLAIGLALSLVVAGWHDVSKAWDTWAYHLPYAARFVGLVGPDTYTFSALSEPRYEGFPLFCEALQGLFWRVTGRPECANFVALFSLFGLVAFVRRVLDVPAHVALIAYLAIPLVQIHATQCYVDLPANVALTILVLVAHRAWSGTSSFAEVILAGAMAIAAGNSKFQLVPLVLAGYLVLAFAVRRAKKQLLFLAVALPLVFATPLANLARHGNPAWPVEITLFGHHLPANETTYDSAPHWLEHTPRSARFALSVLEVGVDRWSVDQWTPPDHPAKRMGGFFGAYVVAALAAIVLAVWKKRARVTGAFVAGATIFASLMPQSHELRYYMFWMLLVVTFALFHWARERPRVVTGVALAAFVWVAAATHGTYLYPCGDSFAKLVATHVDESRIFPGARICVDDPPWSFLWAPRFHGRNDFTVYEADRCP